MPIGYVNQAGNREAGALREFLRLESAGGVVVMSAAVVALIFANTRAEGLTRPTRRTCPGLALAVAAIAVLAILNIASVRATPAYFFVGLAL